MRRVRRDQMFLALCLTVMLLGAVLTITGCPPTRGPEQGAQTTVTIGGEGVTPPPKPPTAEVVMTAPVGVLGKPAKDPFVPLIEAKGKKAGGAKAGPGPGGAGAAPSPGASMRVTGFLSNKEMSAILEVGGESWIVKPGDTVKAYQVVSVSKGGVVLRKGKEQITLTY